MKPHTTDNLATTARHIRVRGRVQGVGFRPFVWRLAHEFDLRGSVANGVAGVAIEIEGAEDAIDAFIARLRTDAPPRAHVTAIDVDAIAPLEARAFEIVPSQHDDLTELHLQPDLAMCAACHTELRDPTNRRYRYPFIVCTDCGPRWSILDDLPWDRPRTAMRAFTMCDACEREYSDPTDRRFHAEPIACPACGPQLDTALEDAARTIRDGRIVALRGLGGFHLLCDANNERAIAMLRERKQRPTKPLAVMVPDVEAARRMCMVSDAEARWLSSPEAPIVLLHARDDAPLARNIAPTTRELGVMLAYTPLHALLLDALGGQPIVATSGNKRDEPIAIDDGGALADIADTVVAHDRPIRRPVDDSVMRVVRARPMLIRAARGFAPMTLALDDDGPTVLAVGAHLKSTVALAAGRQLILSPHIGDLESVETARVHRDTIDTLLRLARRRPDAIAHDLHPDYRSTRIAHELAERFGVPMIAVQHHHAHAAATMLEHGITGPALAVTWDGTGYGSDGTVWGGEFVRVDGHRFERVAMLQPFRLPGGDAAARDTRRAAIGLLHALKIDAPALLEPTEQRLITAALERGINAPVSTSAGRLLDALAALLGVCTHNSYEGEAPVRLEQRQRDIAIAHAEPWPMPLVDGVLDTAPMVRGALDGGPVELLAARIHATLIAAIRTVAAAADCETVVLTGGCFQNLTLLTGAIDTLKAAGYRAVWPQRIPANDGGIAVGQAVIARAQLTPTAPTPTPE